MRSKVLIIIAIVAGLFLFMIPSMNTIPSLDEAVDAQWSQVVNQYKRRADLVPQLVKTVQGAANFERSTLEHVIQARRGVEALNPTSETAKDPHAMAKFQKAQGELSSALARLLVVVERYPDLKATQNFAALQSQLEGTENRIAVARMDYIKAVQNLNTTLRTFPGSVWNALFFHQDKRPNFKDEGASSQAPDIKFE